MIVEHKKVTPYDTGYYRRYPDKQMVRVFLSQKYAPFTISAPVDENDLKYKSNSKLNPGIGEGWKKHKENSVQLRVLVPSWNQLFLTK